MSLLSQKFPIQKALPILGPNQTINLGITKDHCQETENRPEDVPNDSCQKNHCDGGVAVVSKAPYKL